MNTLSINVFETPSFVVVRLEGQGGFRSGDLLEEPLRRIGEGKPSLVVFDLAKLTFVASLFLRQLVMFRRNMSNHKGVVQMAAVQPQVREVLRAAGLEELFEFIPEAPAVPADQGNTVSPIK